MKKLILLFLILVLTGCATTEPSKPSRQEIDETRAALMQCLASNIVSVDDGTSDALTIAQSLVSLCRNEFHEQAHIFVKNENQRVQQMFYEKVGKDNLNMALVYVLRYRNSKKVK
jgi:hypothetical protein